MPLKEYRALSLLGMFAMGLGLLSVVSAFAPVFCIFGLVAMAMGGYALWHIRANSDRITGEWMACVPLVLAPMFIGWGLSREFARREIFFGHAREFGDEFLEILNRNEPYLAHQLHVEKKHRLDPHMNFQVAYQGDEHATEQFNLFMGSSPAKEIMAAAPNARFQFEEFSRYSHIDGLTDGVSLQYTYETPTSGKTRFWMRLKREYSNYTGRADWQLMDISVVKPRGD